jgi:hypothetical protein
VAKNPRMTDGKAIAGKAIDTKSLAPVEKAAAGEIERELEALCGDIARYAEQGKRGEYKIAEHIIPHKLIEYLLRLDPKDKSAAAEVLREISGGSLITKKDYPETITIIWEKTAAYLKTYGSGDLAQIRGVRRMIESGTAVDALAELNAAAANALSALKKSGSKVPQARLGEGLILQLGDLAQKAAIRGMTGDYVNRMVQEEAAKASIAEKTATKAAASGERSAAKAAAAGEKSAAKAAAAAEKSAAKAAATGKKSAAAVESEKPPSATGRATDESQQLTQMSAETSVAGGSAFGSAIKQNFINLGDPASGATPARSKTPPPAMKPNGLGNNGTGYSDELKGADRPKTLQEAEKRARHNFLQQQRQSY